MVEVDCPDEEALAGYVERSLRPEETTSIEGHIDACTRCRTVVAELLRSVDREPSQPPIEDDDEALLSSLPTTPSRGTPALLAPGTRVGPYEILQRIGGGGMGVVFAARDPRTGTKVALKLLRGDLVEGQGNRHARERLVREAQALEQLSHPNVIAVHEVGTMDDEIFLAMEFVDGATLRKWRHEEKRGWKDVLDVLIQAGRGLAAAHHAGLIHRDFKPDNVLVGHDGRVRVTDFGLVRAPASAWPTLTPPPVPIGGGHGGGLEEAMVRAHAVLGTPGYMAPEQLQGKPADERSDQFAFCITLFETLYGHRPYRGTTVDELRLELEREELQVPGPGGVRVPRRVRAALVRGLSRSPFDRHPSMDVLLVELERARRAWPLRWV